MSKHTLGPWSHEQSDFYINGYTVRAAGSALKIADLPPSKSSLEEREANARLIAAAPDLLEALHYLHPGPDRWRTPDDEWIAKIESIIAKAEGRLI